MFSHHLAVCSWEDHLHKPGATWAAVGHIGIARWEDHLHKPGAAWAVVGVQAYRSIGLNALQRHGTLGLCRSVHRQCAKSDRNSTNQRCGEEAYDSATFDMIHKSATTGTL